jgi:hypothetical protein
LCQRFPYRGRVVPNADDIRPRPDPSEHLCAATWASWRISSVACLRSCHGFS